VRFELSEEQELLQETIKGFLESECPVTRLREIYDQDEPFDPALWKGMVELGLAGIQIPDQYGGAGLEALDLAVVAEALGYAAAPGPFLGHSLAAAAIALGGSDGQKERWLPRLAVGDALGTVAFAEPGGWQPEDWTLEAKGALSGEKQHVLYGGVADLIVVGTAGGGLAVVEAGAGTPGVSAEPYEGADRTRRLAHVTFDGAAAESLEHGAAVSGRVRDLALVLLAADAFGGASRCVELAVEYAKTREQFGVTIGHFQALKHQLANMAVDVEPARALYWYAAHAFDHAQAESERTAALAKAHVTDRFMQAARDTVEAYGGYGFTWECEVQIWFKRAMFDRAYLGTPPVHRARAAELASW
jgi:alkylation response protein AidB-like acyl-CoA dehydrogenase